MNIIKLASQIKSPQSRFSQQDPIFNSTWITRFSQLPKSHIFWPSKQDHNKIKDPNSKQREMPHLNRGNQVIWDEDRGGANALPLSWFTTSLSAYSPHQQRSAPQPHSSPFSTPQPYNIVTIYLIVDREREILRLTKWLEIEKSFLNK